MSEQTAVAFARAPAYGTWLVDVGDPVGSLRQIMVATLGVSESSLSTGRVDASTFMLSYRETWKHLPQEDALYERG